MSQPDGFYDSLLIATPPTLCQIFHAFARAAARTVFARRFELFATGFERRDFAIFLDFFCI